MGAAGTRRRAGIATRGAGRHSRWRAWLTGQMVGWIFHPLLEARTLSDSIIPARQIQHRWAIDVVQKPTMRVDSERDIAHTETIASNVTRSAKLSVDDPQGCDLLRAGLLDEPSIAPVLAQPDELHDQNVLTRHELVVVPVHPLAGARKGLRVAAVHQVGRVLHGEIAHDGVGFP